jgi:hypothetical protein
LVVIPVGSGLQPMERGKVSISRDMCRSWLSEDAEEQDVGVGEGSE